MSGLVFSALVAVALALAGGALVALDRTALRVVRPPRRPHPRDPADAGAEVEPDTVDGDVPLEGWWLRPRVGTPGPVVVLVHGWGANAAVMLDVAEPLVAAGHELFVFDVRNHGRSAEGPWVTLGQFVADTQRAVAHVRSRLPGRPVALVGHSMGGAAALIAAADDPTVAAAALIAAPHDMYGTLTRYLTDHGMPGGVMVRTLRPFWAPRLGRSARELDPGRRAAEVRQPVVVVQPLEDTRVPPENGRELARDTGGRLVLVEGADHNDVLRRRELHEAVAGLLASV